jgi:hypothetical protein
MLSGAKVTNTESIDTDNDSADFSEFGEQKLLDQKRLLDRALGDNDDIKPIQITQSSQ